jgi:hypothetical protein
MPLDGETVPALDDSDHVVVSPASGSLMEPLSAADEPAVMLDGDAVNASIAGGWFGVGGGAPSVLRTSIGIRHRAWRSRPSWSVATAS